MTLFDLTGKIAVVTGALGKLGPVWIEALMDFGASVYAMDHPDTAVSKRFDDIKSRYGPDKLKLARADILSRAELISASEELLDGFGAPDILVNNAGIDQPPEPGRSYTIDQIPEDMFLPTMTVNVFGAFQVSQVFGGLMLTKGGGSVINIGSLYATVSPDPGLYDHIECDPPFVKPPAYGASKAALLNLTRYLAAHWAKGGVRVNALSPGGVAGGQDEKFKQKFNRRTPMGRMAEEGDLKGPLVFLASGASSYVTGVNLQVDGGFTAW